MAQAVGHAARHHRADGKASQRAHLRRGDRRRGELFATATSRRGNCPTRRSACSTRPARASRSARTPSRPGRGRRSRDRGAGEREGRRSRASAISERRTRSVIAAIETEIGGERERLAAAAKPTGIDERKLVEDILALRAKLAAEPGPARSRTRRRARRLAGES